jgi:hypothetical protein
VIATASLPDLQLLELFVSTLEYARESSESAEKLFLVCDVFYRVAKLYIEALQKCAWQNTSTGSRSQDARLSTSQNTQGYNTLPAAARAELDPYLSRFGFGLGEQMDFETTAGIGMDNFAATTNLAQWIEGNQFMNSLMDEDLSYLQNMGPGEI